jgi:anti-sigma factor RsiW
LTVPIALALSHPSFTHVRPLAWSTGPVACPVTEAQAHGLLDGELDAVEAVAVREHLARCSACAARVAELERLLAALRRQRALAPRAGERLRRRARDIGRDDAAPSPDDPGER